MRTEDMILVSVDDHIIEPPDLFTQRLPARIRDHAPRVVKLADGTERWRMEDRYMNTVASLAVWGRRREELGCEPIAYDGIRRGCYDVPARVDDMNANGVLASLNFPTMPGFGGEQFQRGQDKALMQALIAVYNDWHCDEWCGAHPGRFIPAALLPLWDVDLAVGELRRMAAKGARAIYFPENPCPFGLPSIHREDWDPLWRACVDLDVVVMIHIGTSGESRFQSLDTPVDVANTLINMGTSNCLAELLYSPVPRRFPALKLALPEACVGWLPYFMERADIAYGQHRFWTHQDFGALKPSDILKRNFLYCFHQDPIGIKYRHEVGVERITWECDFPHADSTWPNSPEVLAEGFAGIPDREIAMITHENALRYFNFDPFGVIDRRQATVGALRARARHVDVTPKSMGGIQPATQDLRPVTMGDMARVYQAANATPVAPA
ncbi:MAG: amidohydrolase family protein [Gammaproteobacteria bacterium]